MRPGPRRHPSRRPPDSLELLALAPRARGPDALYFVEPLGGRGLGADPPRPSWIPIEVEGGLISCGGKGLGVMDLYSATNVASHEIVCAIIRTPTAPRQPVRQLLGFVPRISTAMTLGGGAEGIGLDGAGLGEAGVSGISVSNCND
jgi:hypothetical protein